MSEFSARTRIDRIPGISSRATTVVGVFFLIFTMHLAPDRRRGLRRTQRRGGLPGGSGHARIMKPLYQRHRGV